MNPVLPQAAMQELLADLVAAGATLNGLKIHLYTANVSIGPQTVLADLVEPTFTGYAKSGAVAWGAPLNQPGGGAYLQAPSVEFRCTADSAGDIVRGWYASRDAVVGPPAVPETLVLVQALPDPVGVAKSGDGLWITPKFGYPDLAA